MLSGFSYNPLQYITDRCYCTIISILMIMCAIVPADESRALVITNKCETCSYIADVTLSGYSYENESVYFIGNLGDYDNFLTWDVPAGEYSLNGLCGSGESKGFIWIEFPVLTGSVPLDYLDLFCPEITTTSTSSSTTTVSLTLCAFLEIYGKDSQEIEYVRYVRDNVLMKTREGRELVKLYYQWSPVIVKAMAEDELLKEELREIVESVLSIVTGEVECLSGKTECSGSNESD